MEPIAVTVRGEGRWVLIHRCTDCGRLRLNRIAGDDNLLLLMQLAALPLTMPPFPFNGSRAMAPAAASRQSNGERADSRRAVHGDASGLRDGRADTMRTRNGLRTAGGGLMGTGDPAP
jgi:hypothetical protein